MTQNELEREVCFLKAYAVASTLLFGLVFLTAAQPAPPQKGRFAEIDAERINILQPDGKLALVLANDQRLPGPIVGGREIKSGRRAAGILFFNGKGDESGGLTYASREKDAAYEAGGHFSFDQYNNDQVVFLSYQDNGKSRGTGLYVVDRPVKPTVADLLEMRRAIEVATGEERTRLERQMREAKERGDFGTQRVFVGSADRTAMGRLRDTAGRDRIRLVVDSENVARIEILDEKGAVVHSIPE
jgi:hypothetical protein